jgi:hypothetical protein
MFQDKQERVTPGALSAGLLMRQARLNSMGKNYRIYGIALPKCAYYL